MSKARVYTPLKPTATFIGGTVEDKNEREQKDAERYKLGGSEQSFSTGGKSGGKAKSNAAPPSAPGQTDNAKSQAAPPTPLGSSEPKNAPGTQKPAIITPLGSTEDTYPAPTSINSWADYIELLPGGLAAVSQYVKRKNQRRRLILEDTVDVAPVGSLAESLLGWHVKEIWHDGGDKTNSAWDLSAIVNDAAHTATEIDSMFWANEGLALITSNPQESKVYGFTCSTPYDASTAVYDGARSGTTNNIGMIGGQWSHDGNYYVVNMTFDKRYEVFAAATPFKVDSTDASFSKASRTELGFDDTIWGNGCFSPDGTAFYAIGEMQTNIISMLKRNLNTPYDLGDRGTLVTFEIESQGVTSISSSTGHLSIDASETLMWYCSGGTLASVVMSTPGDIETAVWTWTPVTLKLNPQMDGGNMTSAQFDHTGELLYTANSGNTSVLTEMRVHSRSGASRNTTGTITGTILNAMTKTQTLTDGGVGVLDLNPLVLGLTTKMVESMQWGVDGKYLITLDGTNQTAQLFECSTPYDPSTAVVQGVPDTFLAAGSSCVGMDYWGEYAYHVKGSTDTLNVMSIGTTHAARYTTQTANSIWASMVDTELGHTQASDGQMTFSEDGYSVYGMIEKADGVYFAKGEINTDKYRYDVDEITEVTSINIDSDFSTLPGWANADMRVVGNGTYVLYLDTDEILYLGTMSTPNDVSTLTWDKTNTLDVSGDGAMVGFAYNQALTKFWFLSNTSGTPVITAYE